MSDDKMRTRLLEPGLLGKWMAERADIWQMDLLNANGLATFASDRDVDFWPESDLVKLWQLGLLHADLALSRQELKDDGLIFVGVDDEGRFMYADERPFPRRPNGWGSAAAELEPLPPTIEFYFHPFRYYVLYNIERTLKINIKPLQVLEEIESYSKVAGWGVTSFQKWSASEDYVNLVGRWNETTALAVATEPWAYHRLTGRIVRKGFRDMEVHLELVKQHWEAVSNSYALAGVERIEDTRQELCVDAHLLEPNIDILTMLRLADGDWRLKLRGRVGGAVILLTMAEMLRRGAEQAFGVELPEEDECGFGFRIPDAKKQLYGSTRLLDEDRNAANEFLRQVNLDYAVRLHWYVEGSTEYYALQNVFEKYRPIGIQVINLGGQVVQRRGRGLAFSDSLKDDIETSVFSFVSIDGDKSENLEVVRQAANNNQICGMFFISAPDFEFGNFRVEELEQMLWDIALEHGADANQRSTLHNAVANTTNASDLLAAARGALIAELGWISKGKEWGERLMKYADKNRNFSDGRIRPIIEAIQQAFHAVRASYTATRTHYRVDPTTGRPVQRKTQ